MKYVKYLAIFVLVLIIAAPALAAKKPPPDDYMGGLYGDLYVVKRDIDGVPELDGNGCLQPLDEAGNVIPLYYDTETGDCSFVWLDEDGNIIVDYSELAITVDFGRLNLGRSPDDVLDHAFDEAIKAMNSANTIEFDPAGRLVLSGGSGTKTIDSPLENLALYIKMMTDGTWMITTAPTEDSMKVSAKPAPTEEPDREELSAAAAGLLYDLGFTNLGLYLDETTADDLNNSELLLAASLLAAAADKSGTITVDMLVYVNSIYGINDLGMLPGETSSKSYYDFREYTYDRATVFGGRSSGTCAAGYVWVLAKDAEHDTALDEYHWVTSCREILTDVFGSELPGNIGNIAAFVMAADDALGVIEYIHNYSVPEDIYALDVE